jgi:hypothetical protein
MEQLRVMDQESLARLEQELMGARGEQAGMLEVVRGLEEETGRLKEKLRREKKGRRELEEKVGETERRAVEESTRMQVVVAQT